MRSDSRLPWRSLRHFKDRGGPSDHGAGVELAISATASASSR